MLEIQLDEGRCDGCGLCEAFCPVSVFDMLEDEGRRLPVAVRAADCWACDTCVGQCPTGALRVVESEPEHIPQAAQPAAPALSDGQRAEYAAWAEALMRVLRLRWNPVAISLVKVGAPLPDAPQPREKLRYCQSLMAARRGKTLLMPARCHACPDGTTILGLTELPPKLASGELYIRFGKLASIEAAKQMIAERPHLATALGAGHAGGTAGQGAAAAGRGGGGGAARADDVVVHGGLLLHRPAHGVQDQRV